MSLKLNSGVIALLSIATMVISTKAGAAPVSIDVLTGGKALGFTTSATNRNYEGIDTQVAFVPHISLRYGSLFVSGLNVGYDIKSTDDYNFSAIAIPRFLGYKTEDNPVLEGLSNTNYSIHAGLALSTRKGDYNFSGQFLTDLLGESGGTEFIGGVSRTFSIGDRLSLTPALGLNWQDSSLVDEYYGIGVSDSTADRPAYQGGSTLNSSITVTASYRILFSLTAIAAVRTDFYGDNITSSPIVDKDTTAAVSAGLIYTFPNF